MKWYKIHQGILCKIYSRKFVDDWGHVRSVKNTKSRSVIFKCRSCTCFSSEPVLWPWFGTKFFFRKLTSVHLEIESVCLSLIYLPIVIKHVHACRLKPQEILTRAIDSAWLWESFRDFPCLVIKWSLLCFQLHAARVALWDYNTLYGNGFIAYHTSDRQICCLFFIDDIRII